MRTVSVKARTHFYHFRVYSLRIYCAYFALREIGSIRGKKSKSLSSFVLKSKESLARDVRAAGP